MNIGISWIEALGYLGALATLGTYSMKTMIPLRVIALCANGIFVVYGYMTPVYPQLVLHAVLLPLNSLRAYQMLQLTRKVSTAPGRSEHGLAEAVHERAHLQGR